MTKSTWRDRRSFGPTIIHPDDDASWRAICTWCCFRVGANCTHKRPPRRIPNPEATPEWCEMLADMMAEAKKARAACYGYWRDALLRAAECGSDCLRDTWATVPSEMRDELGFALREAGIVAMDADLKNLGQQ